MTRPDPRKTAALSAALSGAVDLGALKARADAARQAAAAPAAPAAGGANNGSAPWIVDVTEAMFQAVVEQSLQVPVVVVLGASYSPESQQLAASLTRLAQGSGGSWILARVDLEASPRIGQAFGAQSVPTVIAVAAGQPVDAFAGPLGDAELSAWIARLLDALRERLPGIRAGEANAAAAGSSEGFEEPEDPRFVAAEEAFERGDYDGAVAAFEQILAVEPSNELAKEGLAQARFAARSEGVDPSVIAKADAAPDDVDAQLAAADAQVAMQQAEEAFARLVSTVRRVFGDDRDRVRTHLVGLFELFPADDPRVAAARRNLASALY